MRRAGDHRLVATCYLVLALRAGLGRGETMHDCPLDCLIIAELEMEKGHLLDATPVAAIERIRSNDVERPGDRISAAIGEEQQQLVAHQPGGELEKGAREIGVPPLPPARVLVEGP